MCSGIVVWRRFMPQRAWLAMRLPRWNNSTRDAFTRKFIGPPKTM
jgi:hypothetical protein